MRSRRSVRPPASRTAELRRPLGLEPPRPRRRRPIETGLAEALPAANEGISTWRWSWPGSAGDDPLDADAHFVRGLAELGLGHPAAAVSSLRRALYVDPAFGLAAFTARTRYEERGDGAAAARAYEQALRTLTEAMRDTARSSARWTPETWRRRAPCASRHFEEAA